MVESETEHTECPDCEGELTADHPEFVGDGTMFRTIACTECGWSAVEEWVLHRTAEEN
jgi:hypothetical protein